MSTETAWSTSDPETVTAYLEAVQAQNAAGVVACRAAAELGKNKGPLLRRGIWGSPDEVVGLAADDPTDPPDGWVYSKGNERLVPRRGKAGESARQWLADHQAPPSPRNLLAERGLPRNGRRAQGDGYRITSPEIFAHDGTLWARYEDPIGDLFEEQTPTWTPRKLSEYHAAREAHTADGS